VKMRKETLVLGISRDVDRKFVEKGRGTVRIQPVWSSELYGRFGQDRAEGFDFAEWLKMWWRRGILLKGLDFI